MVRYCVGFLLEREMGSTSLLRESRHQERGHQNRGILIRPSIINPHFITSLFLFVNMIYLSLAPSLCNLIKCNVMYYHQWFKGGMTNISYNCLDRNIESGSGDKIAIYWEANEPGNGAALTYNQLLEKVCQVLMLLLHTLSPPVLTRVYTYACNPNSNESCFACGHSSLQIT